VLYVEELIGPDTVNTIPVATMDAFRDHGKIADTLADNVADAQRVLGELGRAGIARALDGIDEATPLDELERRLFEVCRRHGRQTDDQTVLIVRVP